MERCNACPRGCNIDRAKVLGYCGTEAKIKVARIGLHKWEEPCICYGEGSETIFFSGCNLKCVFCQNYEISHGHKGVLIDREKLCEDIFDLQNQGACNINLVTPSHYTEEVTRVLEMVKPKLNIPVVYNSSGYDGVESIKKLDGLVDIYLPDIKYFSSEMSGKYSGAVNYFSVASRAIDEMIKQVGYTWIDENGKMEKGVLVRHLVLPGGYRDSIEILKYLADNYQSDKLGISLMCQYFPGYRASEYPELNRKLTTFEYKKVVEKAEELGFEIGFIQERSSATEEYVPSFDYK